MFVCLYGTRTKVITNVQNTYSIKLTLIRLCNEIIRLKIIYLALETIWSSNFFIGLSKYSIPLYFLYILDRERVAYDYQISENEFIKKALERNTLADALITSGQEVGV